MLTGTQYCLQQEKEFGTKWHGFTPAASNITFLISCEINVFL